MGLFNFFSKRESNARSVTSESPATSDGTLWGTPGPAVSGVNVDEVAAINIASVYSCVTLRAQVMASLPICTFRKNSNGSREVATQHPSNWIFNKTPDDFMTAFNARETTEGHKLLRGNSYYEVVRNFRGQVVNAYLLDPRRMSIVLPPRDDYTSFAQQHVNDPIYRYSNFQGPPITMDKSEVLHFTNWSMDGFYGVPPLTVFRESMGLTAAANSYASQYFRKGGYPLGFLTKPGTVGAEQRKSIFAEWNELHGGVANAHNVGLLSGGLDWKAIGISNQDAQLLGLRQFQKYEMAMIFRTPPALIGDIEQPVAKVEEVMLLFIMLSILPELKRNESQLNMKMFTPKEMHNYYMEYNADGMLRGDAKSRAEALQIQARNGALLINEWREMENRNKVEAGDIPLIMASQLATLQAVTSGTANLDTTNNNNKTSTGKDKVNQLTQEQQFNSMVTTYMSLSESDRKKLVTIFEAMNLNLENKNA